jgi:hypothetical protein
MAKKDKNGIIRNIRVGNFNENVYRKTVTPERVVNFMDEMGSTLSDFDTYLWGSWPEKKSTWDLDLLLKNYDQDLGTGDMENIILKGLNSSLVNNNFLADLGFTNNDVKPFNEYWNHYNKTGDPLWNEGLVYGPQWFVDNKLYKDRTKFKNGTVQELDDNMLKVISGIPYSKMLQNGVYDKYYKNKPVLLKERRKIYG